MELDFVHLILKAEDRKLLNKLKSDYGVATDEEFFISCLRSLRNMAVDSYNNAIGIFSPNEALQVQVKIKGKIQI